MISYFANSEDIVKIILPAQAAIVAHAVHDHLGSVPVTHPRFQALGEVEHIELVTVPIEGVQGAVHTFDSSNHVLGQIW